MLGKGREIIFMCKKMRKNGKKNLIKKNNLQFDMKNKIIIMAQDRS